MYKMTWKEYSNILLMDADYFYLTGYLKYCKELNYIPVDKQKVIEKLAFIKVEIDSTLKEFKNED